MSDVTSGPSSTRPSVPGPDGGERRRLDEAPSARIAATSAAASGSGPDAARTVARPAVRPLVIGLLVADIGAIAFFVLGLADLGIGLVAVAGFFGWLAALVLVWRGRSTVIAQASARQAVAAFLGAWTVIAGLLIDWVYALLIGGVLSPLDYWAQRYGWTALLALVAGAGIAALRAR